MKGFVGQPQSHGESEIRDLPKKAVSIRARLIIALTGISLVLMLISCWLYTIDNKLIQTTELQSRADRIMLKVATEIQNHGVGYQLDTSLRQLGVSSDVSAIIVSDSQTNQVIASSKPDFINRDLSDVMQTRLEQRKGDRQSTTLSRSFHGLNSHTYAKSQRFAFLDFEKKAKNVDIHVLVNDSVVSRTQNARIGTIIGWSLFRIVFFIIIALVLIYRLVSIPMRQILQTLQRRADGDETTLAPKMPNTEIGRLANGLNLMLQSLDQKQRELREREELFKSITASSPVGMFVTDKHGIAVYCNDAFVNILGYDRDIIGRGSWLQSIDPEDRGPLSEKWRAAFLTRSPLIARVRALRPNGKTVWLRAMASPIYVDGEFHGYTGTIENISERVMSHVELQRQIDQNHQLLEDAPYPLVISDIETAEILYANRMANDIVGAGEDGLTGQSTLDFYSSPSDRKAIVHRLLTENRIENLECEIRSCDGRDLWMITSVITTTYNGKRAALFALTDITARKLSEIRLQEAQQALQQSETLFRSYMENAPIAIFVTDANHRYIDVNPTATSMTGYSREEFLKMTVGEHMHAEMQPKLISCFTELQRTGRTRAEISLLHRDGRPIWVEISAVTLKDGKILAFVSDITQRKASEAELKVAQGELENALIQAKDLAVQAESANIAKSTFLATVSHEIRTPLNGVVGMSSLLLDTALTEEQQEYAQAIEISAQSLLEITNDMLDFSRIESGKMELEVTEYNLRSLLADVIEVYACRARDKNIQLATRVEKDVPSIVFGDPTRTRQVLLNLLSNAVKFTTRGSVTIECAVNLDSESQSLVTISVRDTGIGIPAHKIDTIFESFRQADGSATRRFGGTGLGLSISRQLVELMGGTISAQSTPGEGSCFSFTFPLLTLDDLSSSELFRFNGRTAIVLDPHELEREFIVDCLKQWGCEVILCDDFLDLNRLLSNTKVDFIILDDSHGEDSLIEHVANLQRHHYFEEERVIVVTNTTLPANERKSFARIQRPIVVKDLSKAMRCSLEPLDCYCTDDNQESNSLYDPKAMSVLIVEDDSVNRSVASKMLSNHGYQVTSVANGFLALEEVIVRNYDVILMDCIMPELDGYETTLKIREIEQQNGHRAFIVALTGEDVKFAGTRCLDSGMDDCLMKPFEEAQLRSLLNQRHRAQHGNPVLNESDQAGLGTKAFRQEHLVEMAEGNVEFLESLIDLFVQSLSDFYRTYSPETIKVSEYDELARAAHRLMGSCSSVGAESLASLFGYIEEGAKKKHKRAIVDYLNQLPIEFVAFESAYRASVELRAA